jgi:CDP-paratose 2-epimerase
MDIAIVTGSAGLIGGESVEYFAKLGFKVIGIDNNMRKAFFGESASTEWNRSRLEKQFPDYKHYDIDIRDTKAMEKLFSLYQKDIKIIIHTAAQPSHDWSAKDPVTDFTINANGTLTVLEAARKYCRDAVIIFTSTNKVYGDKPNSLPLIELDSRWEIDESHAYYKNGIDESMTIDQSTHSLFGASKASADLLVQEYGRYFGMKTACFRGGCLTGPHHSGAQLHGFLSYLMNCALAGGKYYIYGYKGKQVRDNIHSYDLVNAFYHFYRDPGCGEVYNIGGSRHSNCSVLEAVKMCNELTGTVLECEYVNENRTGDHIWWISDVRKFKSRYKEWDFTYDLKSILQQMHSAMKQRANRSGK